MVGQRGEHETSDCSGEGDLAHLPISISELSASQFIYGLFPKDTAEIMHCLNSQQVECQPFSLELRELYIRHLASNPLLKANKCVDHPVCTFSSGK